ncbi:MAG: tetratricopeptide repeat protein [Candidatus Melainabacteria bacterium]|nr:tetratricopeptide repeat protein [Candidatus Melainabacteria bacterium]
MPRDAFVYFLVFLILTGFKPAFSASSETVTSKEIVSSLFPVRARMEKDHRIRLNTEQLNQDPREPRVHIYMVLSEQALPYTVSLGWVRVVRTPESAISEEKKGILGKSLSVSVPFKKHAELLHPINERSRGLSIEDENGFIIASPGMKPLTKDYRKADYAGMTGFDQLSERNLKKAEKFFSQAVSEDPGSAKFQNNIGAILSLLGDYSEASGHLDRALRIWPDFPSALTNRALLSLAIGHPDLALKDAGKALKIDPAFLPARIASARALLETGKAEEAMSMAAEMKASMPGEWQILLLLGDAQLAARKYSEARETFKRLTVLSPGNSDLMMKLAKAEEQCGNLDDAIERARRATITGAKDPRSHILLARYLEANQDLNAATLQLERAMELNPAPALRKSAMGALLRILVTRQKLDDADLLSKKWSKDYDKDPAAQYNRGWILSQLDRPGALEEAIEAYKRALSIDSSLVQAHYNLGLLYAKSRNNEMALSELRSYLKEAPDGDSDREQARDLIGRLSGKN